MIVRKRVFSENLNRAIDSHLSSDDVYMCIFVNDLVNLLDDSIVSAAASAKAITNNVDIENDEVMKLYESKYIFLKDEIFMFDNKTGFKGLIDKKLYIKDFLTLIMSERKTKKEKALAIKLEVEALKMAMKENFSVNYVHKEMNKTFNSRSNIHKCLMV